MARLAVRLGVAAAAVMVFASCGSAEAILATEPDLGDPSFEVTRAQQDLVETFDDLGLTSLSTAMERIELADLTEATEFTFFAPTDEAFTALTADGIADLLADPERLRATLRNHIVESPLGSDAFTAAGSLTAASGRSLAIDLDDGSLLIDGAAVIDADNTAGASIVHVIDTLLVPE